MKTKFVLVVNILLIAAASVYTYISFFNSTKADHSIELMQIKAPSPAEHQLREARDVLQDIAERGIPTLKLSFHKSPHRNQRFRGSASRRRKPRMMQLDYNDPYHNEPYDPVCLYLNIIFYQLLYRKFMVQGMEQQEWAKVTARVRQQLGIPNTPEVCNFVI